MRDKIQKKLESLRRRESALATERIEVNTRHITLGKSLGKVREAIAALERSDQALRSLGGQG